MESSVQEPASRSSSLKSVIAGVRALPGRAYRFAAYVLRRAAFKAFERVLPARDDLWSFCSWGHYYHTLDNPRAVLEAVRRDPSITCVVLHKAPGGEVSEHPNVLFVPAESIRGAYYLARSRVVLSGYTLRAITSYARDITTKHIIVMLRHGVLLRRVGRLFPRETWWAAETFKYSAMFASSERERQFATQAYDPLPPERIWVTGQPRNNILLGPESELPSDYRAHLEDLRQRLDGRRLVLYAPTWRDTEAEHYRFTPDEVSRLAALMHRHDAVFGIHGHPNARHRGWYRIENPPAEVLQLGDLPDVTVVLRETAVLVSDFSSVFLDFLLTGKPIIHFAYDYDSYLASRIGFLYEPEEFLAGPVPRTFEALLRDLDHALGSGLANLEQYMRVRNTFHEHHGDSVEAVVNAIRGLVSTRG